MCGCDHPGNEMDASKLFFFFLLSEGDKDAIFFLLAKFFHIHDVKESKHVDKILIT